MAPKDDLGVEYSADVEAVLKDPKSTVLKETLDYFARRRQAEEDKKKKEMPPEKKKLFDIF